MAGPGGSFTPPGVTTEFLLHCMESLLKFGGAPCTLFLTDIQNSNS